ncbi:hypothetical protein IJ00_11485 [Calothrix sp. 336/3]|nr:hypothetical protein IJ00_11485 [Calothrix sp. 336/3]
MYEKQVGRLIKALFPIYQTSTDIEEIKQKTCEILSQFCKEHEINFPPLTKGERETIFLTNTCPNCGSQEIHFIDYPEDDEVLMQCWDCE